MLLKYEHAEMEIDLFEDDTDLMCTTSFNGGDTCDLVTPCPGDSEEGCSGIDVPLNPED